jgi:hypothetical protein
MLRALAVGIFMAMIATSAVAQKVGIGAWENPSYTMLDWIESEPYLSWYYDWRADQIWDEGGGRRSVEFVPMIHSARNVGDKILSDRRVTTLLGFNEPDGNGSHQAGLSVEEAIALWPRLEARGLRLGSPATTQGATLGRNSWQRRFMNEVKARNLRVDFMAVHYYSSNGDVAAFKAWLEAVHAEYGLPIWVTEFALIDWNNPRAATYERNAAFAEAAIPMLERLPFVERHAWFAANPYPWKNGRPNINLVDDNLKLTLLGKTFERLLSSFGALRVADAG